MTCPQGKISNAAQILILDDDRDALEEIQEILELEDLPALTANTAERAIELLCTNPLINVVVTDVHIVGPDGAVTNGIDFISQVREQHSTRALSFIVLSGDAGAIMASIESGVVEFLTKPLMPEALLSAIQKADAPEDGTSQDLSEVLMRTVEQTTRSLQRVSVDLAEREREMSDSQEAYDRRRLHGGKLRQGLSQGHILPWFQPQVCIRSGTLIGFEALVRWDDPASGLQNPDQFLPLAKEIGLMSDLDSEVQRQALDTLAHFHDDGFGACDVGINLTAGQLADSGLIDYLGLELERTGLQPKHIAIEVLESAMLDEVAADPIKANIKRLGDLGYRIELDDFGTGHAGLSSLRDLTVTRIKIDRSFVCNVHMDAKLQKFTRALIALAKTLDIEVLAEGVESEEELSWLEAEGCDAVQGYFIAKPMPALDALHWARQRREATTASHQRHVNA